MKNKILVEVIVPEIDEKFDVYIPVNRKIGNVIRLLNKAIFELSNGSFTENTQTVLYDKKTGKMFPVDNLVRESGIENGSTIVLL